MLKYLLLALVVTCSFADDDAKPEVQVEDGVLVLTGDNFDSVIDDNEFVLVEFYAPWCGHCKKLAPEYAKAAQALEAENSPVKLGKVDATEHKELGSKFGVRGYPTLKFFKDGAALDYTGGRTEETIVNWVKKKSGPPAVTIATKDDAETLLANEVAIVGFFKDVDSADAKAFVKAASKVDDYLFGICSVEDLMKEYEVEKEGVVVFKKFDEGRAELTDDLTVKSILEFVASKAVPVLTEFSQETAQKLFSNKDMIAFFLAMAKSSEDFETVSADFKKVAAEHAGKLRAVYLNTEDKASKQVLDYMDMSKSDYPTYRILHLSKSLKYKPEESDMSYEKIKAFADAFVGGDLKPYLKSQDLPEDWDKGSVKVLVGTNFREVAFDDTKHVFVEFYAPWCGHCKKLAPIWDELGDKYAGSDDVIIAKMDSTLNEVEDVSVKGFPTLKFFPANSDGKIVDFKGDRSLEDLLKFVSKYAEPPTPAAEEEKPDTPEDVEEEKEENDDKKEKDEL